MSSKCHRIQGLSDSQLLAPTLLPFMRCAWRHGCWQRKCPASTSHYRRAARLALGRDIRRPCSSWFLDVVHGGRFSVSHRLHSLGCVNAQKARYASNLPGHYLPQAGTECQLEHFALWAGLMLFAPQPPWPQVLPGASGQVVRKVCTRACLPQHSADQCCTCSCLGCGTQHPWLSAVSETLVSCVVNFCLVTGVPGAAQVRIACAAAAATLPASAGLSAGAPCWRFCTCMHDFSSQLESQIAGLPVPQGMSADQRACAGAGGVRRASPPRAAGAHAPVGAAGAALPQPAQGAAPARLTHTRASAIILTSS